MLRDGPSGCFLLAGAASNPLIDHAKARAVRRGFHCEEVAPMEHCEEPTMDEHGPFFVMRRPDERLLLCRPRWQ